ncbi:MAG: hypothetical protein IKN65_07925 [Clostridia bacterium]|nr:hypothetical protein [Clostridia bacterium]
MKAMFFLLVLVFCVFLFVWAIIYYKIIVPYVKKTEKEEEQNQNLRKTFPNDKLAYILNKLVWRAYRELENSDRNISMDDNEGFYWIVDGVRISEIKRDPLRNCISSLTICSSLKSHKATLEKLDIPKELIDSSRHWRALNDIRFQILDNLKTKK